MVVENGISLNEIRNNAVDLRLRLSIPQLGNVNLKEGLSSAEAANKLQIFGPNKPEEKKESLCKFLGFMWTPLLWVIEIGAAMSIGLANGYGKPPDWQTFLGIVAFLVFNSTVSIIGERSAAKAASVRVSWLVPKTNVLRDGRWSEQNAEILVPGDIISIKVEDIVPADVRLLQGDPIKIDQSALTGEARPITKNPGDEVLSGSTCEQGEIEAVVIATGARTYSGKADNMVNRTNQTLHYEKVLTSIRNFCIYFVVAGMVVETIVMYSIQHHKYRDGIDNLLVLLIGGIPIAMPIIMSRTVAIGFDKLSKQGAITKTVAAVEEMARMDVVCTNTSGILTQDKLFIDKNLSEVFVEGMSKDDLMLLAARASRTENQDSTDAAIVAMLSDTKEARVGIREVHYVPYNQVDKRATLTYIDASDIWYRLSRGAPEQIMILCNCNEDVRKKVNVVIGRYAECGFRSLAVGRQLVTEKNKESPGMPWQFLGLLPLFDPPRCDSINTICRALKLGVNVKMITDDYLALAKDTGSRLGMGTNIYPSFSLLGQRKSDSTDGIPLDELIEKADGFSGVFPEHKYEIVKKLQDRKHICGITGVSVHDAPALQKADIGIAATDATDAARIASDIVLTQPGLCVIISAVWTSRCIFQRMKNYMIYACSVTIHIVFGFMLIALIWKSDFSSFMVLIIAVLNYVTIMTISKDSVEPSVLPYSWNLKEIITAGVVLGGYLAYMTVVFFWAEKERGFFSHNFALRTLRINDDEMMTALYLQVSVVSQALIFVIRTRRWYFNGCPGFRLMSTFIVTQLVVTLIAVYANWSFARIKGIGWGWAGVIWIYNIVIFFPLDLIKFVIQFVVRYRSRVQYDLQEESAYAFDAALDRFDHSTLEHCVFIDTDTSSTNALPTEFC